MYLLKPYAGWCHMDMGEFHGNASYLTDVPMQFLDSFELFFKNYATPAISLDEEGSDFIIVVDEYATYIVSERDETKLYKIEVNRQDFIRAITKDIEENFEEFVTWDYFDTAVEKAWERTRRQTLKSKIDNIKSSQANYN